MVADIDTITITTIIQTTADRYPNISAIILIPLPPHHSSYAQY
jgi:hypothetical protein